MDKDVLKDFICFLKPYNFDWDSKEHIDNLINKFFDQYQPESSKREDLDKCEKCKMKFWDDRPGYLHCICI